jgi:hypothetical protein
MSNVFFDFAVSGMIISKVPFRDQVGRLPLFKSRQKILLKGEELFRRIWILKRELLKVTTFNPRFHLMAMFYPVFYRRISGFERIQPRIFPMLNGNT